MPWSVRDVDKHIGGLSTHQKQLWVAAANAALAKCEKDGGSNCDATAIKIANAAAKKAKKEVKILDAIALITEAGRMISTANHKKLTDAMNSMKAALETIMPLLASDSDENVKESFIKIEQNIDPILNVTESNYQRWELVNIDEAAKILAQNDSYSAKRCLVDAALRKRALLDMMSSAVANSDSSGMDSYYDYYDYGMMPYVRDLYDEQVIYSQGGELYQCDYKIENDVAVLGEPTQVEISYVPTTESANVNAQEHANLGTLITFTEKAVSNQGDVKIKVISPGWGSSGYYSEKMLERDGPKVFKKGLHMYMNHPTAVEALERPERDLRDLVGALSEDAKYDKNGVSGPGLYASATVFEDYRNFIDDAAPYIGVSIVAGGHATEGEAEGRRGPIINNLEEGYSVDYVTLPGRGGEVLPLLESVRTRNKLKENRTVEVQKEEKVADVTIDEAELNNLREAAKTATELATKFAETNTSLARMREAMIMRDARDIVVSELGKIDMLTATRERLVNECMRTIPIKDNEIDREALVESIKNKATDELKYLESVSGITGGKVVGMGSNTSATEFTDADFNKMMTESMLDLGFSETQAKIAAKGR